MVNLAVAYAGPDSALATLAAKLRRVYGNPARTYEFVTGYKSATNVSSHNADANGRAHAMDIFVGPGNLTEAQGIDLAERLRLEGKRGSIPGHPDRLAYIIHRGRIAGDHTGWEWVAYTGADWHGDHIHVSSVFDYYWGDPIPGNPADYNSTADWNLWESEFLSGDITPINPSEEDDMFTEEDRLALKQVRDVLGANGGLNTKTPDTVAFLVRDTAVRTKDVQLALTNSLPQLLTKPGAAVDVTGLAKALAGQLEARDLAALASQLQVTVKDGTK